MEAAEGPEAADLAHCRPSTCNSSQSSHSALADSVEVGTHSYKKILNAYLTFDS
jgi:hypothetical protein